MQRFEVIFVVVLATLTKIVAIFGSRSRKTGTKVRPGETGRLEITIKGELFRVEAKFDAAPFRAPGT